MTNNVFSITVVSDIAISRVARGRITLIPPEVLQVTISKVRNFVGLMHFKDRAVWNFLYWANLNCHRIRIDIRSGHFINGRQSPCF
jgi:effector-binding domain-containing protein